MIRDWPLWAQAMAVLGWCGGMGALGGYLIGLVLRPRPVRTGRHRR